MSFRKLSGALLGASAIAIAAMPAPASAQRVDRIVAFGDSYADDGNAFQLAGVTPPSVYANGRFSGGIGATNYIDTLGVLLGAPIDNFAIGGALTNNQNTNAGLPGFTTEYLSFLAGGGPAAFPRVSGTFGENDLLAVSIGGNDARLYQQTGGTLAGAPAAATAAVATATAGFDALVAAGARNISYLGVNAASAPEVALNPGAQAIRGSFSNVFNAGIRSTLVGYAADGVIVNYLDLALVGNRIIADPAAFGLTSAGPCPAAQATRCVGEPGFNNQFLFYVDGLHLTPAGFAIVARYIDVQLKAPLGLQAPSDIGVDTARQFGRTLGSRMDGGSPRDGEVVQGARLFLVGDTFMHDVGRTDRNDKFDIDGSGVTAGVEFGMNNALIGVAGNYSRPRAKFGNESTEVRTRTWQVGGFAGYALGPVFVQGHAGYGKDRHRITRTGVIDNMTARPDGSHWTAGAKAGFLAPVGIFRLGPVAGLDYARAKVDGHTEEGDPALTLSVDDLSAKALTGNLGIEARTDFAGGGIAVRPYIAAMLEKDLKGDSRSAVYALTAAPEIVNTFAFEDRSKKAYARVTGGASAAILSNASLDFTASGTFGKKQGEEVSAHVGFRLGF